ncbi:transposase domain-containing protein [Chitinophaga sp. S165]
MLYSLIGTCSMNTVNPYEWLEDIISRINDHSVNRLSELLPHNWKS